MVGAAVCFWKSGATMAAPFPTRCCSRPPPAGRCKPGTFVILPREFAEENVLHGRGGRVHALQPAITAHCRPWDRASHVERRVIRFICATGHHGGGVAITLQGHGGCAAGGHLHQCRHLPFGSHRALRGCRSAAAMHFYLKHCTCIRGGQSPATSPCHVC